MEKAIALRSNLNISTDVFASYNIFTFLSFNLLLCANLSFLADNFSANTIQTLDCSNEKCPLDR